MFKNYFKSAYRNIVRNKFYSFIIIIAFIIGLATISYHILNVATSNPVDAIKYE